MTGENPRPNDRFTVFLGVACAALAVLTLLLAWQNRSLKAELATALGAPPPGALKIGDTVNAFDVVDAAGNRKHVAFGGQGETLLLVFSSTCGACRQTIPTWNRLLAEHVPSTVQIVGIQTDFQPKKSGSELPFPDLQFPVFGATEPAGEPMSKFPAIPAAALIDATGSVKSVWIGVPTDAQVGELRRAIAG
jgi:peroxiredoxin